MFIMIQAGIVIFFKLHLHRPIELEFLNFNLQPFVIKKKIKGNISCIPYFYEIAAGPKSTYL